MTSTDQPRPTNVPDVSLKPQNGRAGLRHWRHDALAGLVVSMVSLPLSSGIAIASGAPPIYGIISSIIAGLIFPFVGGSYVTISGPAAGLAPALLVTMAALGGAGDADHVGAGYPLLLAVIALVGVAQVVMARFHLARFGAIFPASVVEGMLGAIGILILVKALPLALGYLEPVHAHGFVEYVGQIPHWIAERDGSSVLIAATCLAVFGLLSTPLAKRVALFRTVPAHVFAVGTGVAMAAAMRLHGKALISVPANPLSGLQFPAFGELLGSPELWKAAAIGFLTLTLIDGVESLATAQAVDRIDPFKRKSRPNAVLRAMGISNVVSSLLGGLTVIPGGVKSKTCIEAGGRTLWANFANAVFLLAFLFVAPGIVSQIPKAALGAVLVYTGWKMIHPRIGLHLRSVGREQLTIYVGTIVATLLTDLLIGVAIGTAMKLVIVAQRSNHSAHPSSLTSRLVTPFRDPVADAGISGSTVTFTVNSPLVCFNAYRLLERLECAMEAQKMGQGHQAQRIDGVVVKFGPAATLIDHTAAEQVFEIMDDVTPRPIQFVGLEDLQPLTNHRTCMRIRHENASPLVMNGG